MLTFEYQIRGLVEIKLFRLNTGFWHRLFGFKGVLPEPNHDQTRARTPVKSTGLVAIIILLLISSVFILGRTAFFTDYNETENPAEEATVSLEPTKQALPETKSGWSAYRGLSEEVNAFFRLITDWGPKDREASTGLPAMKKQGNKQDEDQSEMLSYQLEVRERAQLNAETLARFAAELEQEFQSRLEKKQEQISKEIEEATKDKRKSMERKAVEYRKQIEAEYFLQLTNIQFKLQLPGLPEEDQVRLKEQMAKIKDEMQVKTEERTDEFEEELSSFIQRRVAAGEAELAQFKQELLLETRVRYQEEKSRLEEDFSSWQRRKEEGLRREGKDSPL
jgi:hypothetical protein